MSGIKMIVDIRRIGPKIDRHVYGHFSEHLGKCIYDGGYWVGEDSQIPNVRGIRSDIVEAMKAIKVPNIRWPGGCFADDYHWMDGIGPLEERTPIVNVHWGGTVENNHFGTHEFMDLCEQIGCEPYICGNVGSGTVREMRDWIEYLTDNRPSPMARLRQKNGRDKAWGIKFFGIGNENWGCGGFMTAEQYSQEYRKFSTFVRNYEHMGKANWWQSPGIIKIAGGHGLEEFDWAETLMRSIPAELMGGLSVHCYVKPGAESHGTCFSDDSWYETAANTYLKEALLKRNISIMDYYDPGKKVLMAVDEWGIWVDNEPGTPPGFLYQQNTMRSAMCAVLMLHMFHRYADRISIANLAQTINVLQSIILADGERMIKTPTYYVFDLLKGHMDADYVPIDVVDNMATIEKELPHVDISSSLKGEVLTVSLINLSTAKAAQIELEIAGTRPTSAAGRFIDGKATAHNTFDRPNVVCVKILEGITLSGNILQVSIPPSAIASIEVRV